MATTTISIQTFKPKLTESTMSVPINSAQVIDVETVKCECCEFTEDATPPYIASVREKHDGRWICGLCAEAVKEESLKSQTEISTGEALDSHINSHNSFKSSTPPPNPTQDLISVIKHILRRSLNSPRNDESRSSSCFSATPSRSD